MHEKETGKKSFWASLPDQSAFAILLAIVVGFAVGAVLLACIGVNPAVAYGKLWSGIFSKPKYMVWSVVYATPLIFTGLAVAFSFKTGVFNIGAEGQFVVGALAAAVVSLGLDLPPVLHAIACALAAMLAGAAWGAMVGWLRVKKGINEVLSYIMFNWIAFYLSNYMVNTTLLQSEDGLETTKNMADSSLILLPDALLTFFDCKSANWGFVMAAVAAILVWFIIQHTTFGFRLRAVGFNKNAAAYAGINTNAAMLQSMAISGALAGLGGMVQLLGNSMRISQFAGQEGFGFQGITVALIAASSPIGCIFSALFYGALKYGGTKLSLIGAPSEVIDIIMGVVVLCIAVSHMFRYLLTKKKEG